jgi:hypothetical protein
MPRRLVPLLVAVAALCAAAPAAALTKQQADAVAVRALKPLAKPGETVLFGLPHAVGAAQSVAVASGKRQGLQPGPKLRAAGRAVWVYWLDQAYGARFEHPGRILLVDDRSGTASRPRATLWYPLVDGRRPAYLRSPKAYAQKQWRVWSNVGGKRRVASTVPAAARVPSVMLNEIPAGSLSSDCLLMYGAYNDPFFSDDFVGMEQFADSVGLRSYYATTTRAAPLADVPGRRDVPTGESLTRNIDYLAKLGGCKDILLYLDGHGSKNGPVSVAAGDSGWVFVETLQTTLREHPEITFKVKIDSCFAGRFLLSTVLKSMPNLLVLEASSNAVEASYSTLDPDMMTKADGTPVARAVANPNRGEFTHRNLVGLTSFAESKTEVQAARSSGGSLLARMLARAFELGAASDGAQLTGRTHPLLYTNLSSSTSTISAVPSHTHPQPNPGYSYLCNKVSAKAGATLGISIGGPLGYSASQTATLPSGTGQKEHVFSFKIGSFGDYRFTITATAGGQPLETLQQTYSVPTGATPTGPFACPPPP